METKLYVGNLSFETTGQDLRTMFNEAGKVISVDLVMDRQTGKPKGFAFVTMSSQAEAEEAIKMYDTGNLNPHSLKVHIAKAREEQLPAGKRHFTY